MKILLTGNIFHGYDLDLQDAIEELGHETVLLFNNIQGPFNVLRDLNKKIIYGILPSKYNVNYFKTKSIEKYNQDILKLIKNNNFDLVIFIGGKTVFEETLNNIKIPKVLWFMDGIKYYDFLIPKFKLFDKLFFFEPTDISFLKNKYDSSLLNLGFSKKRFFPINFKKKYDLSFIGSYYENRNSLLARMSDYQYESIIIGDFKKSKNEWIKKKNLKQQITIQETNQIFNTSKININIHHQQSIEGLNVRSFELLGTGNVQILENKKVAMELFDDGINCIFYENENEFVDKINFYLKNDTLLENIRKNAYEIAVNNHTWNHRIQEMLTNLNENKIIKIA